MCDVPCSYWRIQLLSAKVHTIKESSRQPTQPSHTKHGPSTSSVYTLTALIHEDGQLKDTAGSTHDVYNTQYKVQYEVAKSADGSWRIVDGDDL